MSRSVTIDTLPAGSMITETNPLGFTARLPDGELRSYRFGMIDGHPGVQIDVIKTSPDFKVTLQVGDTQAPGD